MIKLRAKVLGTTGRGPRGKGRGLGCLLDNLDQSEWINATIRLKGSLTLLELTDTNNHFLRDINLFHHLKAAQISQKLNHISTDITAKIFISRKTFVRIILNMSSPTFYYLSHRWEDKTNEVKQVVS